MALIHRWPLITGQTLTDAVGSATLTNNGTVTFDTTGASFDGTKYLSAVVSDASSVASMSIWVKPSVYSYQITPFALSPGDEVLGSGVTMFDTEMATYSFSGVSNNATAQFNSTNFPSNAYTLIVITFNGYTMRGYRNSTQVTTAGGSPTGINTNLGIGSMGSYSAFRWRGKLADCRLFSHVLTTDEISSLVSAGSNPITNPQYSYAI